MIVKDNYDTSRHADVERGLGVVWPARSRLTTPSRCSASARPAPSCSPSRTWPSGPSRRTRPWAASCPATRAIRTPSTASRPAAAAAPAASVAASFGVVGLGTDTGNSIRGPSSHNLLAGIRSTMGLTSRDGIVPLDLDHDIGGPMGRTLADAVAVFDVIAGHDPADAVTARSREDREDGTPRRAASYLDYLRDGTLAGSRIGVVRQLSETETTDAEIQEVFERALEDMRGLGAADSRRGDRRARHHPGRGALVRSFPLRPGSLSGVARRGCTVRHTGRDHRVPRVPRVGEKRSGGIAERARQPRR